MHIVIYQGDDIHCRVIVLGHRGVVGRWRVACKLAGIEQFEEGGSAFLVQTCMHKSGADAIVAHVSSVNVEFVRNKAEKRTVEFLIKSSNEPLVKELTSRRKPLCRHPCRSAVAPADDIGTAAEHGPDYEPYTNSQNKKQSEEQPEEKGTCEQMTLSAEMRV